VTSCTKHDLPHAPNYKKTATEDAIWKAVSNLRLIYGC